MSIKKKVDYEPWKGINFIQTEQGRLICLLEDVRDSAAILKPALSQQRLDSILERVEDGQWTIQEKTNTKKIHVTSDYILDLSEAKKIIESLPREKYNSFKEAIKNYRDRD